MKINPAFRPDQNQGLLEENPYNILSQTNNLRVVTKRFVSTPPHDR
ncbi:MAG: hypothetical protein Q8908_09865 [Bacteroidota bacterium]|nr:hypothetical protein [Bacteroidota bacterium]